MGKKNNWYNFAKVLSYNAVFNFIVGPRGVGKSFGAKERGIRNAITKGEEVIYLRRYKNELQAARATFFADVAFKFPLYDFRINGSVAEYAHVNTREDKKREWTTVAYFVALSTAQNQKSVSYPKVKLIIFDEFILEEGALRYLPNEVTAFINFYSTVDRNKDKTKVLLLANSVSVMNPYFIYYEIRPDQEGEFVTRNHSKVTGLPYIIVHFHKSQAFKEEVLSTRFGQFISETEYAKFAVDNDFQDNHGALLAFKDAKARYMFTLETKNGSFSIWHNFFTGMYYIQDKLPGNQDILTLVSSKMDTDKTLIPINDRNIQNLRTAYRKGNAMFDKPTTRNTFAEIFRR